MTQFHPRPILKHLPFILLILAQLTFGLFTFRDYGLSWDEPLFYDYGEALGYAYTPANWLLSDFDLNNAYGSSGDDHKTRGPAYLLLARKPVHLLELLGVDEASAWHLVNFLTFLLGVYIVYRFSLRWMGGRAAFGAAVLFSTQPLLLGHAFINPKDMPFLVFYTGGLVFGFEMVDEISKTKSVIRRLLNVVVAAFFLGIATSIRVLAPLSGILVVIYAILKSRATVRGLRSSIPYLLAYTILAIFFMFVSWPYLWEAPLTNFFQVFRFMSNNPTGLQVLFGGEIYHAYELPRRYLPTLLAITLTEPVWLLFLLGFGVVSSRLTASMRLKIARYSTTESTTNSQLPTSNHRPPITDYWLAITSFIVPLIYVLLHRPPMYDGFRHFLFILPPVFATCGLGLDAIFFWWGRKKEKTYLSIGLHAIIILVLISPGIIRAAQIHPYEYTYYNSFVGGIGGAFRTYETDYWLTCYKEAMETFNEEVSQNARIYVKREPYIASYYARSDISVLDYRRDFQSIRSGDYLLVNTRTNEDEKIFRDAPVVFEIGRQGAVFCVVKQIP